MHEGSNTVSPRPPIDADNFEIKLAVNEVPIESVGLLLFRFSLKDRAKQWLNSLPADSILSCEQSEEIIENVALNHHQWASERSSGAFSGNKMNVSGKFEVDAFKLMSVKLDALAKKFEAMGSNTANAIVCACDICGSVDHAQDTCPLGPMQAQINQLEQCIAITGYNQR
ncbi:uncharacterized protein LOC121979445 [Zingiber officinale]|uniref:uncharacterized protein LOC121979445 n=1 Tax=Zingiber officinale TaxID=94328 RepID=UPI001C4CDE69|nr:uncharacterized protein LOC121979445 [Zingiber officinale]